MYAHMPSSSSWNWDRFPGLPLLFFSTIYLYNYIIHTPLYIRIIIVAFWTSHVQSIHPFPPPLPIFSKPVSNLLIGYRTYIKKKKIHTTQQNLSRELTLVCHQQIVEWKVLLDILSKIKILCCTDFFYIFLTYFFHWSTISLNRIRSEDFCYIIIN